MFVRSTRLVSRAVHVALFVVVLVVVSFSSASAATTVAPLAVPGIAAIRMGGGNYAQTHLPQYETVFFGPGRLSDPSYIKQQSPGTRACSGTMSVCTRPVRIRRADMFDCSALTRRWRTTRRTRPIRDSQGCCREPDWTYKGYPNQVYANPGSASYQLRARRTCFAG